MRLVPVLGACVIATLVLDAGHARSLGPARVTSGAAARDTLQPPPSPIATAQRYGSMSSDECAGELGRRHIPHERLGATAGVLVPVRLAGPLSGVTFRTLLPEKERASSPYEIFDCRLLLAIDDFSRLLAPRKIVEAMYFSVYRPPPPGWKGGVRHEGGLAIDIAYFRNADGTGLNIERDFLAEPAAAKPCAPGHLAKTATPPSIALRAIACAAIDSRSFDVVLTPDYDLEHRNHFHLEVSP